MEVFKILKVAICDNEIKSLSEIEKLVHAYEISSGNQFALSCFNNGMALLTTLEDAQHFDIFLLDIVMPEINGMQLASSIRQNDESAIIIFLTSSPEFALESYDVAALSYLMKPIHPEKLSAVLDKAILQSSRQKKDCILLRCGGKIINVLKNSIEYVEVRRDKLLYYLSNNEIIETYGTMNSLAEELMKDVRFIKPHRSFIVNMDYIRELNSKELTMTGNFPPVPISRGSYPDIKSAYIAYMMHMAGKGGHL